MSYYYKIEISNLFSGLDHYASVKVLCMCVTNSDERWVLGENFNQWGYRVKLIWPITGLEITPNHPLFWSLLLSIQLRNMHRLINVNPIHLQKCERYQFSNMKQLVFQSICWLQIFLQSDSKTTRFYAEKKI